MFFKTLFYTSVFWPGVHQSPTLTGIRREGGNAFLTLFYTGVFWTRIHQPSSLSSIQAGGGNVFLTLFYTSALWPGVHQSSSLTGIWREGECFLFNPVLHLSFLDKNSNCFQTLFTLVFFGQVFTNPLPSRVFGGGARGRFFKPVLHWCFLDENSHRFLNPFYTGVLWTGVHQSSSLAGMFSLTLFYTGVFGTRIQQSSSLTGIRWGGGGGVLIFYKTGFTHVITARV